MRDMLQGGTDLNALLDLVESYDAQKFESFYSGDTIWRNRWRVNQKFFRFLKSDELDDIPAIRTAKQTYISSKQKPRRMLKILSAFWCLMFVGIVSVGYFIATKQIK